MGVIHHRYQKALLLRCRNAINALAFALFAFAAQNSIYAQPVLSLPVFNSNGSNGVQAQITVSNCYTTYAQYLLQVSTNLTDWSALATNDSFGPNFSFLIPANSPACFYREQVISYPLPNSISQLGILCKSNMDLEGNNVALDSFDSSNPLYSTGGQWTVSQRKANANVAVLGSITNSLSIGDANIFGAVYTGLGSNVLSIAVHGSVGSLAWVGGGISGIQPGYWRSNLNLTVPDVATPNTSGWLTALPSAANGVIMLTNSGAGYYVGSLPSSPLVVTAPTRIWVAGSASLGVTISNVTWVAGGVTNTTVGQLILYVGRTSGSGDSLTWSGYSNVPGYASNFQIYGLPSLTAIGSSTNSAWIATIYAPEANLVVGAGGNSAQDSSGQIIVNSISFLGHWNFHFDEHLATLNPFP